MLNGWMTIRWEPGDVHLHVARPSPVNTAPTAKSGIKTDVPSRVTVSQDDYLTGGSKLGCMFWDRGYGSFTPVAWAAQATNRARPPHLLSKNQICRPGPRPQCQRRAAVPDLAEQRIVLGGDFSHR